MRVMKAIGILLVLGLAATGSPALSRELSFAERVEAQRAIERVHYEHRIGTKKPFEVAVPREVIEEKVRDYLRRSLALERIWGEPVTAATLEQELQRIATNTVFPERLEEIYAALGNDAFVIQECFARSALVRRRTQSLFAADERIHGPARARAEALRQRLVTGGLSPWDTHPDRRVLRLEKSGPNARTGAPSVSPTDDRSFLRIEVLSPKDFDRIRTTAPDYVGEIGLITENEDALRFSVVLSESSERVTIATYTVEKRIWTEWWSDEESSLGWQDAQAVATEMGEPPRIVDEPECWRPTAVEEDIPMPREKHTAVWTGSEMLVWGGKSVTGSLWYGTGWRYDPLIDVWTWMSDGGAPSSREGHSAIWTGAEMIIWGGAWNSDNTFQSSGGRYDPVADHWWATEESGAPLARKNHTAIWTGAEMIVWGGYSGNDGCWRSLTSGGRYSPWTNTWSATSEADAPDARYGHAAVWTGTEMIVWGAYYSPDTLGGRYDPAADSWSTVSEIGAPTYHRCVVVWTGSEMLVWTKEGNGRYDPASNSWTSMSDTNLPALTSPAAVWTGKEMIVWGGTFSAGSGKGGVYDSLANAWSPTSTENSPLDRFDHTAVWTGHAMIIWGGDNWYGHDLRVGGLYFGADPDGPDSDTDGVQDACDTCPGQDDFVDSDSDGIPDGCDDCPQDANNDADLDGLCGDVDNCPADHNTGQEDTDSDGRGDTCDICPGYDDFLDVDSDGVPNSCDSCPVDPENDIDSDGLCGNADNCPVDYNPEQEDIDGDGDGDLCEVCPGYYDPVDTDSDGVPNGCDVCPGEDDSTCAHFEIAELAEELGRDPLAIYLHVRNNFRFEPYFGYLKGPQATLETKRGNDYDLAGLTAALLEVSGFDLRYSRGTAIIPASAMVEWLGLEEAAAAGPILDAAGITATAIPSVGEVEYYEVDRFWVEVATTLRPGGESIWFPLDTAFKRHDLSPGIPGLLSAVPFDHATYLSVARTASTLDFYSWRLQEYLHYYSGLPAATLADVPLGMTLQPQDLESLPRSLPYELDSLDATYLSIPDTLSHKATIRLDHYYWSEPCGCFRSHEMFSHQLDLPQNSLKRITISYVDLFGGEVVPQLTLDGVPVAEGEAISEFDPLNQVKLEIDFAEPESGETGESYHGPFQGGVWIAIGIDAGQISEVHLNRQAQTIVEATALKDAGGSPDPDDLIGGFLYLAIMRYLQDVRNDDEVLADLTHFKNVRGVSQGIALAPWVVYSVDGVPFTALPGALALDVRWLRGADYPLGDDASLEPELREIGAYSNSAHEHALWEELTNLPSMSTVKSLQLANERDIDIWTVNQVSCPILCPHLSLNPSTVDHITEFASNGWTVTVPTENTPLNDWDGVGYLAVDPNGDYASIIEGQYELAAGESVPQSPDVNFGGVITVIIEDGQVLDVPEGLLGDAVGQSFAGDPVNIANGNFFREETDFSIPALEEPLSFRRYYNSLSTVDVGFGPGWTHQYSDMLIPQPYGKVIWINSRGTAYTFQQSIQFPALFSSPPGLRERLYFVDDVYYLRRYDGRTQTFDLDGKLLTRSDRNGNTYTFNYDALDRLITVTDPANRSITFTHYADGPIAIVTDFTGRTWTYGYDSGSRLTNVTSPSDGHTPAIITQYTYTDAGRIRKIIEPNGGVRRLRYYANGQVAEIVDPLGQVMSLVYNPYERLTEVTDERGFESVYWFNEHGNLIFLTYPDESMEYWTYSNNRVVAHADPLANVEVFFHDLDYISGTLDRSIDPTGIVTDYEYEELYSPTGGLTYQNLLQVTRPGGRVSVMEYDDNGNIETYTDGVGTVRTATHNAQGLPESVTDGRGAELTYVFNGAGQWTSRCTELPSCDLRSYDPRGTVEQITDANGHSYIFEYDLLDRLISETDPENNTTTYAYDEAGRLVTVTNARGHETTFEYDLNNRLVRRESPDGTSIRFEYDELGNVVAEHDELGRERRATYDSRNRPVVLQQPDGSQARIGYDGASRIRTVTDSLGNTTTFEYDAAGRLTARIDATGARSEWTYDENGNLETSTDRRGGLTTIEYDALNRITEVRGPENLIRTADYDGNGNVVQTAAYDVVGLDPMQIPDDPRELPLERKRLQTYAFDILNRLELITDPEGNQVSFQYDPAGNVTAMTDERSVTTTAEYDDADRLVKIIRPDTGEVLLEYDEVGNQTALQHPLGGRYTWDYDQRNRVVSASDPLGRMTRFEYDLAGNLTRQVNADGSWVAGAYDPVNRPRLVRRSDGTFASWAYDEAGNLVRATTEKTDLELVYDTLHRLTSETLTFLDDDLSKTVEYEYDAEGALTKVTDPEGRTIDYLRDLAGRTTSVTDLGGASAAVDYNGYSQPATLSYGNGTVGAFTYDKNGRVTQIDWTDAIANLGYQRDAAGNPTTITEMVAGLPEVLTFQYDDFNRPTSVIAANSPSTRSEVFGYDFNDNLLNPGDGSSSTFDSADQLLAGGAGAYRYDSQGNRFSVDDGLTRIETPHDPSSRLTAVREFVGGVLSQESTLTRDGLGRLVEIRTWANSKRTVHAFGNRLVDYDGGSGLPVVAYTLGDGLDDVLAAKELGALRYVHRDAVNSVRALTDSTGALTGYRHFGQFGRLLESSGLPTFPLGYTGRPSIAGTGLIDLRARFLDPTSGAFLSRDPIGLSAGIPNPYTYAANRPSMFVDPLGLLPQSPEFTFWSRTQTHGNTVLIEAGFTYGEIMPSIGKIDPLVRPELKFVDDGYPMPSPHPGPAARQGGGFGRWLDRVQLGCAVFGSVPGVGIFADTLDIFISVGRGDFVGAGISIAAAIPIPVWGQATGALSVAWKSRRLKRGIDALAETVNIVRGPLKKRLGRPPSWMRKPQAHHDLPQNQRFRQQWDRLGLDIEDPAHGRWVEGGRFGDHQKWSKLFEREWDNFFLENPNATRDQVLDFMHLLRADPRFQ